MTSVLCRALRLTITLSINPVDGSTEPGTRRGSATPSEGFRPTTGRRLATRGHRRRRTRSPGPSAPARGVVPAVPRDHRRRRRPGSVRPTLRPCRRPVGIAGTRDHCIASTFSISIITDIIKSR